MSTDKPNEGDQITDGNGIKHIFREGRWRQLGTEDLDAPAHNLSGRRDDLTLDSFKQKVETAAPIGVTITTERGTTHGKFIHNALASQELKEVIARREQALHAVHKECLDLICTKISRILSGQASFDDHWVDIAGYVTLAVQHNTDQREWTKNNGQAEAPKSP